ncbi:unnamed protein product [Phytophthora lilii]|uniref:Unnamed protein product n=1 Tax=Phytophthora lilii TaxID=2077276 RepID=A0A9W6WMU7_9STRA|nr:unnamed protein product [Phytophthora lilii]
MKEYSLESLKNDTEEVVSRVRDTVFGSDSVDGSDNSALEETPEPPSDTPTIKSPSTTNEDDETLGPATKAPKSTSKQDNDDFSSPFIPSTMSSGGETDNSYSYNPSDSSGWFDFTTTAPPVSTTATPWTTVPIAATATPTAAPTPTATKNASAYDSATEISTSEKSTSMQGGAIAGVVVGAACVMFVLAAFVTMKKRATNQRLSQSKKLKARHFLSGICIIEVSVIERVELIPPGIRDIVSRAEHRDGGIFASRSLGLAVEVLQVTVDTFTDVHQMMYQYSRSSKPSCSALGACSTPPDHARRIGLDTA